VSAKTLDTRDDIRVAGDCRLSKLISWYKRIVLSSQNQRRNADAIDHPHRAGLVVVVARARKPVMRRGVDVVEPPNRPDAAERLEIERPRPGLYLAPHSPAQVADEVPLIRDVGAVLDCADAQFQIDRWTHGDDGTTGSAGSDPTRQRVSS
jgi:hypothetical protein